jgi:acetylornithine deacetylase/succinyl-diaminopimelate desuccinylase-like protein
VIRSLTVALLTTAALQLGAAPLDAADPEPGVVGWLTDYIAIDTTNPPGREVSAVTFLRGILHAEGIPTRVFVSPGGRHSLYARIDADPGAADGTVVLLHHMDVVPAGPGWTVDPFTEPVHGGVIWGRGAVDDKSLGIAHLAAFLELAREPGNLRNSLVFLAVADEESGGTEGTAWLMREHPELFSDTLAVLGEGGVNRAYQGRAIWWGIEVAQKRPLWLRATARGRGGHGSMLNLGSAPHQLSKGIARLLDQPLEYRASPAVRSYLESVAPYQSNHFQQMVDSLDEILERPEPHLDLYPGIPNYLLDTVQVNVIDAGERINVVPASASALIDVRLLPDTDGSDFLRKIREALGPDIEIEVLLEAPHAAPSSTENRLFRCLAGRLERTAPVVPSFIPGITDSRYFRQRGIDAYGFSPFVFDSTEAFGVHGRDERISITSFKNGVETMQEVLRACVTG